MSSTERAGHGREEVSARVGGLGSGGPARESVVEDVFVVSSYWGRCEY